MTESTLNIHTVLDNKTVPVPYNQSTTAEDVCIQLCKQLSITTIARHLFALRITNKPIYLMPSAKFRDKQIDYDLRIRYKVANLTKLRKIDSRAYDYYFHQVRNDLLNNKLPDIMSEKYRQELVGLGITDMYRVMVEKDIPRETVVSEYKKYMPKEVLKRHLFFVKSPIHCTLGKLQKSAYDARYVKAEYLKQLDTIAPEYLSETYKAIIDLNGSFSHILIKVSPYDPEYPGVKYCLESKKDKWYQICSIEELGFVSIRADSTVEISHKNGVPFYLKLESLAYMLSFISLLDGYYRLTCKWIFNICKDVPTPSLSRLYSMKCHGPVGGEFSYAKLEAKRANRAGCFIIRESESKYNQYYIDVCTKDSLKPKTFKLERISNEEFIFNDDLTKYRNVQQLINAYNDPDGSIYLQECLPPSEYDISPLLLCHSEQIPGDSVADYSTLSTIVPSSPLCISCKDLQVYKDRNCLKWDKTRKRVRENDIFVKFEKFPKIKFPELNLKKAKKFCRNPNGDIGGPWCFVENEQTDEIEREYCEISFCNELNCEIFTKNHTIYTHYTNFDEKLTNLTFGIKLWDSDSVLNASASLILTVLPLPIQGGQLNDLGIGIEIFISNRKTGLKYGNKDKTPDYEETNNLLKSTNYTMFSLTWESPFITLFELGKIKPIFLAEYQTKNNLLGYKKNQFKFYTVYGTNVFWYLPFCEQYSECEVHTTVGPIFQHFWPLRATKIGYDLQFHLRAFHSVNILLLTTPTVNYPQVTISLQNDNTISRIIISLTPRTREVIKEIELNNLLNFWEWREYSIILFANNLQFYWKKSINNNLIFELKHEIFRKLRWYSISSNIKAYWCFYSIPPKLSTPPSPLLPECALNQKEENYKGTQDISYDGRSCLPWSTKRYLSKDLRSGFNKNNESILEAWNYCRNPLRNDTGTYCFVFKSFNEKTVEKVACHLRKCKSEDCRMAGTGNDYIGSLNKTRTNRTCDFWTNSNSIHKIDRTYLNDTLYPDLTVKDAGNNCRNPSRNIGGIWCYTIDPNVTQDLCNVRDCDRFEENIIITGKINSRIYMKSHWKIAGLNFGIKLWNPDKFDGVTFQIFPLNLNKSIELFIGIENNEKIVLYYQKQLKKQKTLPHLISTGKWNDYWLIMNKDEVLFGLKAIPDPLFDWKNDGDTFEPIFLSFGSITGNPIGLFFENNKCFTEYLDSNDFTKLLPIGLWSENEQLIHRNFTLLARTNGVVLIRLITIPNEEFYLLKFNRKEIELSSKDQIIYKQNNSVEIIDNIWSVIDVNFNESIILVKINDTVVFSYSNTTKPILIYWFSMGVNNGWLKFSINCKPLDIDGPPRDGGWSKWSQWQCSVSCGGGEGYRIRTCTNPLPNLYGKLCKGPSKQIGRCNNFECGDLNPTTLELIQHKLQTTQTNLVVKQGETIRLENDYELLKIIDKESPESYNEWTLNGAFIEPEIDHIVYDINDIIINNAQISDIGVYVCMLYRINKQRVVLRVISLIVITEDFTITTRATRSWTLTCNSIVLGYIYSDLSLKILLNERIYRDFGITVLSVVDSLHFNELDFNHNGDWKCLIEQKDLNLIWITNYIKLQVKKAPNFYTNLMEDELTKPIFGWLETENNVLYALIIIVISIISLVGLFVFIYFRYCRLDTRWQ